MIHEIFSKHQVGGSELFALEQDLVRQLLLSFDGKVVFPGSVVKGVEFDKVTKARKQGALFSFYRKGLKNGDRITFNSDDSVVATVIGDRDVDYEDQSWKLSPLTYKIFEDKGQLNSSGAYQGASYWSHNGKKLKDLKDVLVQ